MTQPSTPTPLPEHVTQLVGQLVTWTEDRPIVVEGEAHLETREDTALVLGARWARNADAKPVGEAHGLVQFLMERPDGSSRWSGPQLGAVQA